VTDILSENSQKKKNPEVSYRPLKARGKKMCARHLLFHKRIPKFIRNKEKRSNAQNKNSNIKGEGKPRKLATASQQQFPRIIADFKQAAGFHISKRALRKLMCQ
jgi:hypothetical protein